MTLSTELQSEHACLSNGLNRWVGISLQTYKSIRYGLRIFGAGLAGLSMYGDPIGFSAPPEIAFPVMLACVLGPDVVEAYLTRNQRDQ